MLLVISLILSAQAYAQKQSSLPMTKNIICAELDYKKTLEILTKQMGKDIKSSLTSLDHKQAVLYFEIGNNRISDIKDLSPRNQALYKNNPEEFTKLVKKVSLFEKLKLTSDNGDTLLVNWRNAYGWAKTTKRSFEESYLLTGKFLNDSKKWGRFTPKKTEDYYRKYYQRLILGYPAGQIPFKKINDKIWLFGYAKRLSSTEYGRKNISLHSICYFEKYAKSLEITYYTTIPIDNINSNELNSLIKNQIDSIITKTELLVKMITSEIEKKALQPNKKSLQMLNWDRSRRTTKKKITREENEQLETLVTPNFVKEIEALRLKK